jgi:hypothetical protein
MHQKLLRIFSGIMTVHLLASCTADSNSKWMTAASEDYSQILVDLVPNPPRVTEKKGRHVTLQVIVKNPSEREICLWKGSANVQVTYIAGGVEYRDSASGTGHDVYDPPKLSVPPHSHARLTITTIVPFLDKKHPQDVMDTWGRDYPYPIQKDINLRFRVGVSPVSCDGATVLQPKWQWSPKSRLVHIGY